MTKIKVTDDNIHELIRGWVELDPFVNLNNVDVSGVTDMSFLFDHCDFRGDISEWDVSHVIDMQNLFNKCFFDGDISCWDTHMVRDMRFMFHYNRRFNHPIKRWVMDKRCCYYHIFKESIYNKSLPVGMNPMIAFGSDYDDAFKQKIDAVIKAL